MWTDGLTDERVGRVGGDGGLPGAVPGLALLDGSGDPGSLARLGGGSGSEVDREASAVDEGDGTEAGGGLDGSEALREVDEGRDVGETAVGVASQPSAATRGEQGEATHKL